MKLFGNDSNRPRVGRNTADFEPVSAAKAEKARSQARKKADKARSEARREYTEQRTYAEVKAEAKARRAPPLRPRRRSRRPPPVRKSAAPGRGRGRP